VLAAPARSGVTALTCATLLALLGAALLYAPVARLPFFSESYTGLALAGGFDGIADAFDPELVPERPLQHAYFYLLLVCGADRPEVARLVTYGLHLLSCLLVWRLARQLGTSHPTALLPPALFLCFPSVKGLAWVAAVSGPGRALCLLAGLSCLLDHLRRPRLATGVGLFLAQLVGLGFHQSALVLAPLCVLFVAATVRAGGGGPRAIARRLGHGWILAALALAVAYGVYVGFLRPRRYHGMVQAGAILANGVKASLALVPEWLRHPAVEGLRGHQGQLGFVQGGALVVAAGLAYLAGLWRGTGAQRALLSGIALDLTLPVLTTGFVLRYAYLSSALLALALGLAVERARGSRRSLTLALTVLLGLLWARDHVVDIAEQREAGRAVEMVLEAAARARQAAGPGVEIALVDAPDMWGLEDDIPVFNWGLAIALERRGVCGPWRLLRVDPCWTSSDHEEVDAAVVEGLLEQARIPVLVFDRERFVVVEHPPR